MLLPLPENAHYNVDENALMLLVASYQKKEVLLALQELQGIIEKAIQQMERDNERTENV
jgi:hypothetical protein